jgi:hypothetical protein
LRLSGTSTRGQNRKSKPIGEKVTYRIRFVPNARRFNAGHAIRLHLTTDVQSQDSPTLLGFRHASIGTSFLQYRVVLIATASADAGLNRLGRGVSTEKRLRPVQAPGDRYAVPLSPPIRPVPASTLQRASVQIDGAGTPELANPHTRRSGAGHNAYR